jgi:2-methylcitrate dehydratase PrpD
VTIFKHHASCLGTHAPIEATRRAASGMRPADVKAVLVRINPVTTRICRFDYPSTGLEAKFSVKAATALTLLGADTGDPATFSDERVRAHDFLDMMSRIEVRAEAEVPRQNSYVDVETVSGGSSDGHADSSIPSADLPAQETALHSKFLALTGPRLGDGGADAVRTLLDVGSVRDLADLVY